MEYGPPATNSNPTGSFTKRECYSICMLNNVSGKSDEEIAGTILNLRVRQAVKEFRMSQNLPHLTGFTMFDIRSAMALEDKAYDMAPVSGKPEGDGSEELFLFCGLNGKWAFDMEKKLLPSWEINEYIKDTVGKVDESLGKRLAEEYLEIRRSLGLRGLPEIGGISPDTEKKH
ncbi:MAG: hypothetical protein Q9202_005409 [Teloschistes flavicans]